MQGFAFLRRSAHLLDEGDRIETIWKRKRANERMEARLGFPREVELLVLKFQLDLRSWRERSGVTDFLWQLNRTIFADNDRHRHREMVHGRVLLDWACWQKENSETQGQSEFFQPGKGCQTDIRGQNVTRQRTPAATEA
ncbi:hypothetical protein [Deinococcus ruber]|uniref:Uncharacterized protein n=1 Tax=Deinococcus ruber TaxID=1848197 RepID=A0A918CDF4_9DEIO|nr:hypothetical protein [Deinococcus ruber]GGR15389.1 hypothetical protein GCM10008957_30160 [Deinococcus ruber]